MSPFALTLICRDITGTSLPTYCQFIVSGCCITRFIDYNHQLSKAAIDNNHHFILGIYSLQPPSYLSQPLITTMILLKAGFYNTTILSKYVIY